jgi:nitrogen-specific signal transduction histidine kinase
VALVHSEDALADFAHEIRQPLSALEALTSYLDLIIPEENTRVREQLRRIHVEIDHADRILIDGMRTLRAYLPVPVRSEHVELAPGAPPEGVVEEISRPLTKAAMASVTY